MSFKDRFLATKIAIENILFEKEIEVGKKISFRYFLIVIIIFAFIFLVNFFYFTQNAEILSIYIKKNIPSSLDIKSLIFSQNVMLDYEIPMYWVLVSLLTKFLGLQSLWVVMILNFIFSFIGCVGIYAFVSKTRNERSGILAVIGFMSTPFFWDIIRKPSNHSLTFLCLVWSYYFYMLALNEEQRRSIPLFVFLLCIGLLSNKFFFIYAFPCFSLMFFLFRTVYYEFSLAVFFPTLVLFFLFYLKFGIAFLIKSLFFKSSFEYFNLKGIISTFLDSGGISFFVMVLFFVWMIFADYAVYSARKVVMQWFFYPLLFSIIFFNRDIIKFSLVPLSIGFSPMFFNAIRRYAIYIFIVISLYYGFSGFKYFSVDIDRELFIKIKNAYALISKDIENLKDNSGVVINVDVKDTSKVLMLLDVFKEKYGTKQVIFSSSKLLLPFSTYLISDEKKSTYPNIFEEFFSSKNVYVFRNKYRESMFEPQGKYINIDTGDLKMYDVVVSMKNDGNIAFLDCRYLNIAGIDIHGPLFELEKPIINTANKYIVSGFKVIRIKKMLIDNYSLNLVLKELRKRGLIVYFKTDKVVFEKSIGSISSIFDVKIDKDVVTFRMLDLRIMSDLGIGLPILKMFSFTIPFEGFFIPLSFDRIIKEENLIVVS